MVYTHGTTSISGESRCQNHIREVVGKEPDQSEAIPRLRSRRSEMLKADADEMEERARQVVSIRRKKRTSKDEEEQLRDEASKLRTEVARLRTIADQLIN